MRRKEQDLRAAVRFLKAKVGVLEITEAVVASHLAYRASVLARVRLATIIRERVK